MLELPESHAISKQITATFAGRTIVDVIADKSPHGFAWYSGTPDAYPSLLTGRTITSAQAFGGQVEIDASDATMLFNDGVNLRYLTPEAKRPAKHQLLVELDDGSALVCSVQMYGGLMAYPSGTNTNPYHLMAVEKPSPLTEAFDRPYFDAIVAAAKPNLSAKALLATEQRIPGLGNGVLQDILFLSGVHPARKLQTLTAEHFDALFANTKDILRKMTDEGGRDTEKDLYGEPGGYHTLLSRKTMGYPCPKCGGPIERKAYLGGNVYFCPACQPLQ